MLRSAARGLGSRALLAAITSSSGRTLIHCGRGNPHFPFLIAVGSRMHERQHGVAHTTLISLGGNFVGRCWRSCLFGFL
jgi:hypothetical protein